MIAGQDFVAQLTGEEQALSGAEVGDELRRVIHERDLLDLRAAGLAARFAATNEYDEQGYASPIDWIRFNCHVTSVTAGDLIAVGENLQYTLTDASGRLFACLLFGSAAWKCRARDEFIGWTPEQRQERLHLITNNMRFLILPYVKVAHLASWILGQVLRRLSQDWQSKYGHGIVLVETFVERERFAGTSYKAANWRCLGATSGRSRQDRHHRLSVPLKDLYLYALRRSFREELCA